MNTIRKFYTICFLFLIFIGCSKKNVTEPIDYPYSTPVILTPDDRAVYYSNEMIIIEWERPDSVKAIQLQILNLDDFYKLSNKIVFDTTALTEGYEYSSQNVHQFAMDVNMTKPCYFAYRLRAKGLNGVSDWTEIRSLVIYPIITLQKKTLEFNAYFDFLSFENNTYYSGIVLSDSIDFLSKMLSWGYDINQIKVIRPLSGYIIPNAEYSENYKAFDRLVIGFNTIDNDTWPFDVLAVTEAIGAWEYGNKANLTYGPFGGIYRNLKDFFIDSESPLKLAFFLKGSEYENLNYSLKVVLSLDIYF